MKFLTKSPEETTELGRIIGSRLKKSDIISLNGDLGAGKTHLTKGLAEGLGIDEYITSPTFTIVNEYEGRLPLYHFDVYRIDDIQEMYEIGFDEYLFGEGVCIVEWGEIVRELLPSNTIHININILEDDTREIIVENKGSLEDLKEMGI